MTAASRVPTGIEPIRAVRFWTAADNTLRPLDSTNHLYPPGVLDWHPGQPAQAKCRYGCERAPARAEHLARKCPTPPRRRRSIVIAAAILGLWAFAHIVVNLS